MPVYSPFLNQVYQSYKIAELILIAPLLELGSILARRGHMIELATDGEEDQWPEEWRKEKDNIRCLHHFGPRLENDAVRCEYEILSKWRPSSGMRSLIQSKQVFDSHWTSTYQHLHQLCSKAERRPDFIIADYFCEASARDMLHQFSIQIAVVWPQMPYFMAPASYIPGQPGFQADMTLTSENASMFSRFRNELAVAYAFPYLLSWLRWTRRMRNSVGVTYSLPITRKPNYLVLVNSFFGLETPKDLPPLIAPVGPILADDFPGLRGDELRFMDSHDRILYVAFGTHVTLTSAQLHRMLNGFVAAICKDLIDGVAWSLPTGLRRMLQGAPKAVHFCPQDIANNRHASFFCSWFSQRAVLCHKSTVLFFTHCGGSSTNETLFHGVPVLAMGFYFDQLFNSARLVEAGVGISLDKNTFTALDIANAIYNILADKDGMFDLNTRRLQVIARIAARRKHFAADLVEEVMYDQELRLYPPTLEEFRPMHLQTADSRMSFWKAKNFDMWFVGLMTVGGFSLAGRWVVRRSSRDLSAMLKLGKSCWWFLASAAANIARDWKHITRP